MLNLKIKLTKLRSHQFCLEKMLGLHLTRLNILILLNNSDIVNARLYEVKATNHRKVV